MCYLIYFVVDYNKIIEWFSCSVFMFCFLYETMCLLVWVQLHQPCFWCRKIQS